jgi:hypothetical protein
MSLSSGGGLHGLAANCSSGRITGHSEVILADSIHCHCFRLADYAGVASSGLRRRNDRRTGTPDPYSAALYGRVLKEAATNNEVASGTETLT